MRRVIVLGFLVLLLSACDTDLPRQSSTYTRSTVEAGPEDEAIAADVERYFERNASQAPWYGDIESISVVGGVITIDTTLNLREPSGRGAAHHICGFIQGSDVADFTPGHTVLGEGDERIVCPAREPLTVTETP